MSVWFSEPIWCYFALLDLFPPIGAPIGLHWCSLNEKKLPQAGSSGKSCWERIFPRDKEHFPGWVLCGRLPPACGGWKMCPGPRDCCGRVPFARGPLASWYLWVRKGTLRPHVKGNYLLVWYGCYGVIPLSSASGCMVSLGGGRSLRPGASVNFSCFSVACPHVLCVWEAAGPCYWVKALVTQAQSCFSGGGTQEHCLSCRLVSIQSDAWHWPWEGSG